MSSTSLLRGLWLFTASACLGACGFHLRGSAHDNNMSDAKVAIVASAPYAELTRSLRDALRGANVIPVSVEAAQLVLTVREEKLTRRTQTVDQYGRPSDYELIYTVSYDLDKPGEQHEQPRVLSTRRDYGFDHRDLLGKAAEENELVQEMQNEIAQRLLRQIRYTLAPTP